MKLLVPVIPETFYCAGVNYRDHVLKMAALLNREPSFPPRADIGYRANNALIAQGETIVIPKDAHDEVQYEGELVAVFGKECRNVSPEEALDYVFGWTIGNDVSERVWQRNGPHHVAGQERGHLQANGSLDRDRSGAGPIADCRAG